MSKDNLHFKKDKKEVEKKQLKKKIIYNTV